MISRSDRPSACLLYTSISILVYDLNASDAYPQSVLTGDTLFIGDVGRPDLRAALGWSATDLGGLLFESLYNKLLPLPDPCLVYPAHGAGSLCGKSLSKETVSTLGEQRRSNYALQPMSKEAFINVVTADQPEAPAYFNYDAVLNSQERPTLDQALALGMKPLTVDRVLELQEAGAQILDTRDAYLALGHRRERIRIDRDDARPRRLQVHARARGGRARPAGAALRSSPSSPPRSPDRPACATTCPRPCSPRGRGRRRA